MNKTRRSVVGAICLAGVFLLGFVARGGAQVGRSSAGVQAQDNSRRCSNRTLQGTYGIKFGGQSLAGGPFASVARITFDGQGQFTTSEIGRFNGNLVSRTFSGPYTVNADCTGFLDFSSNLSDPPHEARGEFVIVDEGKEFFVLDNEDGWVASGVGKRF